MLTRLKQAVKSAKTKANSSVHQLNLTTLRKRHPHLRIDVEAVDKYAKLSDIEKIFKSSGYSRLPVYIGDIDNIVGIIHHRDFEDIRSRGLKSLRTIIKTVPTVSPDTKSANF